MVKSRPSHSEQLPENSSSSDTETEDSSSELIPRPVSFTTWSRLPPARVVPTDSSARRWVTDRNPSLCPFRSAPASGDNFFKDSLVSKVVRREEALLFHNVPNTPTHLVGPSFLRSRVRRKEFPWSPILFSTRSTFTGCWAKWVDHVFSNDAPFVDILNKVGIADAIKLSPRLGVFRKVDDLEYLVQRWSHTTHTFYTAWGKTPPKKVRGTGNVLPQNSYFLYERFPEYAPVRTVPEPVPDGRVLDLWVAYFARLKTSVKRYEGQDSLQVFPDIQIMYKDLYFVTTSARSIEKSASEGAQLKKRKAARSKGSKGKSASGTVVKKARRELKSTPPATIGTRSPSQKGTQNRSLKLKKEHVVGTRASERLKAKPSTKVEDQSPSPPPASHAATQGSSIEKGVDGDEVDSPGSDHDSTPSCGSILAGCHGLSSPIETSSPKMLTQSNAVAFPAPVHVQVLSVEAVPILSSLLPDDDARVLSEFSARHAGFLLPEDVFPRAFLKPAYTLFADFLRFVRSHSAMELLSSHKNKVVEDLKALSLFGFKGDWFDDLSCRFDRHVPSAALEDLTKITDAALSLELRNNDLRSEIDRLKLELSQGETELEQLNAKRKEVEDARAGLDISFSI
ncbi:hypothetical protein SESBI_33652 [Sesbania bispinosa]|nr:hypothetical protein SESBI_33652 [Sesbania bispinosa]